MKQRCEVRNLRLGQLLHYREASGTSWSVRNGESPQVAHHKQRVCIDRIGVEEVVLHPAEMQPNAGMYQHPNMFIRRNSWVTHGRSQYFQEQPVVPGYSARTPHR